MNRRVLNIAVSGLVMLLAGWVLWLLVVRDSRSSVSFRCGVLSKANDPYLDGSGHVLQRVSWHLGNATRTWGET